MGDEVSGFSPEGVKLLVVLSDEPLLRDSLCAILRHAGYGVQGCESGQEALAALMAGGASISSCSTCIWGTSTASICWA